MRRVLASLLRIRAMAQKERRQLVRDRLTLAMIVGIPALQLALFGYAVNLDVRHVPTAVVDAASSERSRRLVGELEATQTFDVTRSIGSVAEGIALLEASKVGAVVVIPPDLDRRLERGRGAEISILADGSNPTIAAAVAESGEGLGARLSTRYRPFANESGSGALRAPPGYGERVEAAPDVVRPEPMRIAVIPFYNPERRTAVFIVPGLVGVILTMTLLLMTALAVVRERERGTFEFLIATPVQRTEVMVGKVVPYLAVGFVQMELILGLGWLLFDVPIQGSALSFALASLPFIAAMLAMGVLISAAANNQFQAMQLTLFFFLPSMLLSGFMFPFEAMPRPARWIGELLPLTHYLRVSRGILLKSATAEELWGEVAACAAFVVAALGIAAGTFRKRLG
jgi:ABC-2 type transport system permease protein